MSTVREPLLREVLGGVIKHHRGAEGLTLREVCARAGVSPAHWSEVERGRKEVSSEVLAAMCRALDLTLAQVLTESSSALLVDTAPGVGRESALYRRVVRPADPPLQAAAPCGVLHRHRDGDWLRVCGCACPGHRSSSRLLSRAPLSSPAPE